ncbi:transposase [Bdellovibrionota bacterium FG-2]
MSHNANQSFAGESPAASYRPRDPTQALIYQVVQKNWLTFVRDREEEGRYLPSHIKREFQAFMGCGVLANGFVRLKCDGCKHEKLVAFSCKKRGFCSSCGARRMSEQAAFYTDWVFPEAPVRQWVISFPMPLRYWMARDSKLLSTVLGIYIRAISGYQRKRARREGVRHGDSGSITLVQLFGGSVNLAPHFHTLMIEGVYYEPFGNGKVVYHELRGPTTAEVQQILATIQTRVVRALKKRGYPVDKDPHSNEGDSNQEEFTEVIELCQGASVKNKIALGERAGQRVRKMGSFGIEGELPLKEGVRCASIGGFSLHANTVIEKDEKERLEKLCRYVARPPIAEGRLSEASNGDLIYRFKKDWSDGTSAVRFSPLEFLEKLVALVPQPRMHLSRFHGLC